MARKHVLAQQRSRSLAPVVFIVAHPDDEIIGAGGTLLPACPNSTIIHVTDGAPCNLSDAKAAGFTTSRDYSDARRREAAAALSLAGIATTQIVELDLIDQRATHELVVLTQLIKDHLHRIDPDIILTHPYEGGHPDHDATAFAVHAALRQWEGEKMPPQLFELTSYHDHNGQTIRSDLLPAAHCPAVTFKLSSAQRDLKRRMFECFLTQREVLRWFPIAIERFRRAPSYDFTRAPHCGKLHFESFDWGMDGEHWRSLAQQALDALGQSHEPSERPPEGGLAPA